MNRKSTRLLAGLSIAGVAFATMAAPTAMAAPPADPYFCADNTTPMISQAEVVSTFDSTTEVTGLTVTKGTTPVGFTGKYVGNIEGALGKGRDMLLFEMSGAGIDSGARPSGIWAGMSGSPVYTQDGRLIGAVAYGLNSDNLPIAGVTPADYMKAVGSEPFSAPAIPTITKSNLEGASASAERLLVGKEPTQLKPVNVASGGKATVSALNKRMAKLPASSPFKTARSADFATVGSPAAIPEPLVPGGNIAAGFAAGDFFYGSVGTVTAICGQQVWAFGHPMDFAGNASYSIHNASAALVVPDSTGVTGSYKQVSRIGQQIGTITYDGYAAIKGQLGLDRGFPVTATARSSSGAILETYTGSIPGQQAAAFAASAPAYPLYDILDNSGSGTVRHSWRIGYKLPNNKTGVVSNSQVYATSADLVDYVASDLDMDLNSLLATDLADATITSVKSDVTLISRDSFTYRPIGAQVKVGSNWIHLQGKKLKQNKVHQVRPVYRNFVNGKPKGTSVGAAVKINVDKGASGVGKATFSGLAGDSGDCIFLFGMKFCDDESEESEEETGPQTFDELIASLKLVRADRGLVSAEWSVKSNSGKNLGKKQRQALFWGPGVLEGSRTVTFQIVR